jgi:hypothetical protein
MSAIVISSVQRFIAMSRKLEVIGFDRIHFYNSQNSGDLDTPLVALIPFVDFVVLGNDTALSPILAKIVDEASARRIPMLSEDCLRRAIELG